MILTLIRHGQTEGSINDLYYGAADIPVLPESLAELHENAARYPTAKRYFTHPKGWISLKKALAKASARRSNGRIAAKEFS